MAMDFKILRGPKDTLTAENLLAHDKLVNGYWYLTNDTAEVFVCLEVDGALTLKKINECDIDNDFADLESFDSRLTALEQEEKLHTFGYRKDFPEIGEDGHMYVAIDEQKTYVYFSDSYLVVGEANDGEAAAPDVIFGGNAD